MRKISGSEVFKAPMCTLFNMSLGPHVGASLNVHAPLEPIKGRACTLEHKFHEHRSFTNSEEIQHTVDVEYYAPAA
jgi:hypothetical protein